MSRKFREPSRTYHSSALNCLLSWSALKTCTLLVIISHVAAQSDTGLHGCFPLLPEGLHVTSAYNAPADSHANTAARAAWAKFTDSATVNSWNIALTWEQLEPFPGEINVSYVSESQSSAQEHCSIQLLQVADVMRTLHHVGYRSMVGIHVLQGRRLTVPLDLRASDPPYNTSSPPLQRLRDGLRWDSPEVLQRFHAMLKVALPTIAYYGAFHINVAAQLDVRLLPPPLSRTRVIGGAGSSHSSSAGAPDAKRAQAEYAEFELFLRQTRASIATLTDARMSMGVTLSQDGLAYAHSINAPWLHSLQAAVHNTPVEYSPLQLPQQRGASRGSPLTASPLFDIPALLGPLMPARMCLALLYIAHPSPPCAQTGGGGDEEQAQFIADVLAAARASQTHMPGRLRLLSGGHLVDRPPNACLAEAASWCEPCSAAEQRSVQWVAEQRCRSGLLRTDGSAKPAWHAWLEGVQRLRLGASLPSRPQQDVWN